MENPTPGSATELLVKLLFRDINEWLEDVITSAVLARLPVDHIRTEHMTLRDPAFRYEVVLSGGHVYARREWRLVGC